MNIRRIQADITTAKNNLSPVGNPTNDEFLYDVAAYHTQQAVEKSLKYLLHHKYGVDDTTKQFKTHNISTLMIMLNNQDPLFINNHQELAGLSDEITSWEASTRYGEDLVATKDTILKVLEYCEQILMNEIQIKNNVKTQSRIQTVQNSFSEIKDKEEVQKNNL